MRRDLLVRFYPEMERDVIRAMQRNQRKMAGRSAFGSRGGKGRLAFKRVAAPTAIPGMHDTRMCIKISGKE